MSDPIQFYDLYCFNVQCKSSIFNGSNKIISHLHAGSILSARLCPTCQSVLVSAMDIELEQINAEAKAGIINEAAEIEHLHRLN